MKKIKNWIPYVIGLATLIILFAVGNKWSFFTAGVLIGAVVMLGVGYVIDKKTNG